MNIKNNKRLRVLCLVPFLIYVDAFANYSETGRWSAVIGLDIIPVALANLPDGKILAWSTKGKENYRGSSGTTWTTIFDPQNETHTTTLVSDTQHDMFCPGISNLPDGRVMVSGGSGNFRTSIYDPNNGEWLSAQKMNTPRGYHGQVTMGDGSSFTVGGSWSGGRGNKNAEIWTQASGWVPLPLITADATTRDGTEIEPYGVYRDDNHAWLWAAPNGKVFHAGPGSNMHWIDVKGLGAVTNAGSRGTDPYSMNGTTVMYDRGKILKVGGGKAYDTADGSGRVQTIDIRTDNAIVTEQAGLKFPRTMHQSIVLPTGEVVVVGGVGSIDLSTGLDRDNFARLKPESWNPSTNTWTSLAAMVTPRSYHSTAILMSDGRILAGGGGLCDCDFNHPDVELFSPPYLYVDGTNTLATRPVITSAPRTANYEETVNIRSDSEIASFALVRLSSVTHSINNEQRRIPVTFSGSNNNYNVKIPSRNHTPPGNYMLFAINTAGTPSIAKTILIGNEKVPQELNNGVYWLASPSSGQQLTAPSWNNYKSKMLDANPYDDQKWRIKYQGSRIYTIQNVGTGRYLEVENSACTDATQISGSTSSNENNQRWVISKTGNNYHFRPLSCIGKGLNRDQGVTDANGTISSFTPNNINQLWSLKAVSTDNLAPAGKPDFISVTQFTSITISPLANDTGSGLILNAPNPWSKEGGTVALVGNKLTYKSKSTFTGTDKIWYSLKDSQGRLSNSVITITVTAGNANPKAVQDIVNTTGIATTIDALANDSGTGLTLNAPNPWSLKGGSVSLSSNKLRYTPKLGFNGEDKIWYSMKDSQGRSSWSVVIINVSGNTAVNNSPPTSSPDNVTTTTSAKITIDVLANDTGNGLVLEAPNPWSLKGGTVSLVSNKLEYKSKAGFTGSDNIWYVLRDSQGRTSNSRVDITVNAGSTSTAPFPIANADTYTVSRNSTRTLNILNNDTPSTGLTIDTLYEYSSQGGKTTKINNREVSYTPKVGFTGVDDFWYVVIDSQGRKNSTKVTINVTP